MSNKKNKKQPNQKTSKQPIAPATPLELTDEELGQVAGGWSQSSGGDSVHPAPIYGGSPSLTLN